MGSISMTISMTNSMNFNLMDNHFVAVVLYTVVDADINGAVFSLHSSVREMTSKAMGGNVTFRKALQDRLNIIRPSQTQIRDFAEHQPTLTPGIKVG